jgi:hypothetical protein
LADEEPDAAPHLPASRPESAEWPEWAGTIVEAFYDLKECRQYGAMGGAGEIPWTAVNEWALRHGIEGEEFSYLKRAIRALDHVYLADLAAKQAAENKGKDEGGD